MKSEHIEQNLEQLADAVGGRDSFVNDVMSRIENSSVQPSNKQQRNTVLRRVLMKNTIKFTAAAVILVAATLSLTLFDQTVPSAYALEQTAQASHSVHSIHFREFHPGHDKPILAWAEFHPSGLLKQFRLNVPGWDSPQLGPKECIWKDNVASIYLKDKDEFISIKETEVAEKMYNGIKQADPKYFIQKMKEFRQEGKIELHIDQPKDKSKPIQVIATFHTPHSLMGDQIIARIDQSTKLVLSIELLDLEENQYIQKVYIEFYDYNQSIDPSMFTFD